MAGFLLFQWGFALNKSSRITFSIKGSEMHVALDLKKMSTIQNNKTNTLLTKSLLSVLGLWEGLTSSVLDSNASLQ